MKNAIKPFIFLHCVLILYSVVSLLSKKASTYSFLSMGFIVAYGSMFLCLVLYALLWQQVLKRTALTVAFANKAIVIIWGLIWGKIFFNESISWQMLLGAALIIIGIVVISTEKEEKESAE